MSQVDIDGGEADCQCKDDVEFQRHCMTTNFEKEIGVARHDVRR